MKKPVKDYNNTPPRDTPATESQSLVAKWMAPRAVRDNGADESPSRLLSGVMLFRPWDIWIQHASQVQKERSHPDEKRSVRPRPRPGVTARRSIDQGTLEDKREKRPSTTNQGSKSGERIRHGPSRHQNRTGDKKTRRQNPAISRGQGSQHRVDTNSGGST